MGKNTIEELFGQSKNNEGGQGAQSGLQPADRRIAVAEEGVAGRQKQRVEGRPENGGVRVLNKPDACADVGSQLIVDEGIGELAGVVVDEKESGAKSESDEKKDAQDTWL